MNISKISINDFGKWQNLQLDNLGRGLNVIYGNNGSGKTTIRHFLRGMIHGFDRRQHDQFLDAESRNVGTIDVTHNRDYIQLSHQRVNGVDEVKSTLLNERNHSGNGAIDSSAYVTTNHVTTNHSELRNKVDSATVDQVLNVGFRKQSDDTSGLAGVLHSRFGVPYGRSQKPTVDEALIRQHELAITECRDQLNELKSRRDFLVRQINEREHLNASELDDLTRQINALTGRIRESESSIESMQRQIRDLDVSIEELRTHIDRMRNQVETVRVERRSDRLPELLSRLDAIEQQILRWRKVHHDVQGQRGKLRDEMVSWSSDELADRDLLPYEDIRQLLNSLENRVGDLDGFVSRFDGRTVELQSEVKNNREHQRENHGDVPGAMRQTMSSMREELYQLCRELNAQHLVYRRKTIVNELKQLRRCHVEVNDHIKRLVARRESVIQEISKIDPARAEIILRNEHDLCGCNYHEQYLAERQTIPQESYVERRVDVDVSAELARLHQMEDDRRRLSADIDSEAADLQDLTRRRDELIRRRDGIHVENVDALRREFTDVERRLSAESSRLEDLLRQLDAARRVPEYQPNALLENASRYLQQMTAGDLQQVWISSRGDEVFASERTGREVANSRLSRSGKDHVRLAIYLAATDALHTEGNELPLVLDDAMVNIDEPSQHDTAKVLVDFCERGRQVILFTCHRHVANLFSRAGVTVLDLPEHEQRETATPPIRYERPETVVRTTTRPDSTLNLYSESHVYDYIEPERVTTGTLVSTARYLDDQPRPVRTENVRSETKVETIGTRTHSARVIDEATHLADTRLMGADEIAVLRRLGIRTVGDLLNFDPTTRTDALASSRIDFDQIDAWQSQSLLLITIPELRATDAVMLYGCGLTDASQISELSVEDLNGRIRTFSESTRGRRMFGSGYSYDRSRVGSWVSSARSNRDRYQNRRRWNQRRQTSSSDRSERTPNTFVSRDSDYQRREREQREPRERPKYDRSPRSESTREPRESRKQQERTRSDRPRRTRESSTQSKNQARELKFYLELDNNVEAAPSIGPRMAERLEKIGIVSVRDLLEETPENIATQLDYKRVTAEDVRAWQQQATLVCRIPQIRGHDAQFLVACEVTDPDALASMQPEALYKIVGPFAKTKDGQRICRSGKAPDLAEIKDWIGWAQQTRMLKAA